ncbi:hypothetical protein MIND_01252200 [Mycena indigotica]|uniref:Uncharacterized protein n=1 Tax=Mycena indigotica TaxID=2126181 RepID=A0A8H6VW22_9AGAR|nr:uncharacterized protein MIND_01252200 [Mycena indigotica]KAF7292248.1 hypothetical protein MIND_01252200 [Mycena indigotica]
MVLCRGGCGTNPKDESAQTRHHKICPGYQEYIARMGQAFRQDLSAGSSSSSAPPPLGFAARKRVSTITASIRSNEKRPQTLAIRKLRLLGPHKPANLPSAMIQTLSQANDNGLSTDTMLVDDEPLQLSSLEPVQHHSLAQAPSGEQPDSSESAQTGVESNVEYAVPPPPRPTIRIRIPARLRELLPERPTMQPAGPASPPSYDLPSVRLIVRDTFKTTMNIFNLWRSYLHRPTHDPDSLLSADDLSDPHQPESPSLPSPIPDTAIPATSNRSVSLLMAWQNNGHTTKSASQLKTLVHDVLRHPDFDVRDLPKNFDPARAEKQADKVAEQAFPWVKDFKHETIEIEVPSGLKDVPPKTFAIPGLQYRSLVSVITAAFKSPLALRFHLSPFKLFHRVHGTTDDIRVYSELYNSEVFLAEHDNVRVRGELPPDGQDCKLERVVAALMFWSDSTHLANFGMAKLWPIYMLFGNLSKYIRDKPQSGAEHHIAFIPSLPDFVHDTLKDWHPKWRTQKRHILAHCKRELMHAVWRFLLDDEFLHAYRYGIVIVCADGKARRVYPRIFTYSADYPEKVLLATVRDGGLCPCPRCLVTKKEIHIMGFVRDIKSRMSNARQYLFDKVKSARDFIYNLGLSITSDKVEDLLKETSSVPTINAFLDRLGQDFDLHRMLVVDFMHEFELGVWKNFFIHLIRLLYALPDGVNKVSELDRRYRQTPTFGVDTIRRFANNASEMKKLGARDFEDLLQCAIPAFNGLFPEPHNKRLLRLLFRLAEWHSFAKLRMHTEPTIEHLRRLTSEMGRLMREFRLTTCNDLVAYELPKEVAARSRTATKKAAKSAAATGDSTLAPPDAQPQARTTKKVKTLSLSTYKWHAMGDYPGTIPLFGPTDIYSTRYGEALHRQLKRLYAVTNKRDHTEQVAKRLVRLQRTRLNSTIKNDQRRHFTLTTSRRRCNIDLAYEDPYGAGPTAIHYAISDVRRKPDDVLEFSSPHKRDPALTNFVPKLKDHLLGRLLQRDFDGDDHDDYTDEDRRSLIIHDNKIYSTQLLRINYTTYDVRRAQDVINARVHPFVMYWYAQVLRIFNATVFRMEKSGAFSRATRMEFLWVRWMGDQPGYRSSIKQARLPKVGFVPDTDAYAFGFLDPDQVIRAAHLIPDFQSGQTSFLLDTLEPTLARIGDEIADYQSFYVNIFPDRDMIMRYIGGGIGHVDTGALDGKDIEEQKDDDVGLDQLADDASDSESVLGSENSLWGSDDDRDDEGSDDDEGGFSDIQDNEGEAMDYGSD